MEIIKVLLKNYVPLYLLRRNHQHTLLKKVLVLENFLVLGFLQEDHLFIVVLQIVLPLKLLDLKIQVSFLTAFT